MWHSQWSRNPTNTRVLLCLLGIFTMAALACNYWHLIGSFKPIEALSEELSLRDHRVQRVFRSQPIPWLKEYLPAVNLLFISQGAVTHPTIWTRWLEDAFLWLNETGYEPTDSRERKLYNAPESGSALLRPFLHFPPYVNSGSVFTAIPTVFYPGVVRLPAPCTLTNINACVHALLTLAVQESPRGHFFVVLSANSVPLKTFRHIYRDLLTDVRSRFSFIGIGSETALPKASPWFVLNLEHAQALLDSPRTWALTNNSGSDDPYSLPFVPLLDKFSEEFFTQVNSGTSVANMVNGEPTTYCGPSWTVCCEKTPTDFNPECDRFGIYSTKDNSELDSLQTNQAFRLFTDPTVWTVDPIFENATALGCPREITSLIPIKYANPNKVPLFAIGSRYKYGTNHPIFGDNAPSEPTKKEHEAYLADYNARRCDLEDYLTWRLGLSSATTPQSHPEPFHPNQAMKSAKTWKELIEALIDMEPKHSSLEKRLEGLLNDEENYLLNVFN
eukprot:Gregarina_sp_Poly_1__1312@NODE_1322_length_4393_cov_114_695562_g891_i0_p2_GENE_NODE_1322_length_4393_cov_114_695562_g891_i0NODE_1322_length_4393_cov_114_695562_g891_i0_p2_ORF_typecomplete_len501_score22_80Branch/PF02485_21/1_1e07_NODE_1322_length_4393_cov_114_695562_g891_i028524354